MIGDWEHDDSAKAEQEVSIMSLPRHDNLRFELNHATLLVEMPADSSEVIEQQGKAMSLLAQHHRYLIKL